MKILFTLIMFLSFLGNVYSQNVGIGTNVPNPNASLDIVSSDKGLLIPRLDSLQKDTLGTSLTMLEKGLLVFDSDQNNFSYWNGTNWEIVGEDIDNQSIDLLELDGDTMLRVSLENDDSVPIELNLSDLLISHNSLNKAYNEGGAGSGRKITATDSAVIINGTDGFYVTGTLNSGTDVEMEGEGTRMFFNPKKAAFRAGSVDFLGSTFWDNDSIGNYSFACGRGTKASGNLAFAAGFNTQARGTAATTFGGYSAALGAYSTSMGYLSTAHKIYSLTIGYRTEAFGEAASAIGFYNSAYSFGETTLGIGATFYTPSTNGETQFRLANATDRLFVIGNAIDANNNDLISPSERSNALTILKNGNTGFGNDASFPTNLLHLDNGAADPLRLENLTTDASLDNVMVTDANGVVHLRGVNTIAETNTLNEAYNDGGAGTGRKINATDSAVIIEGTDGFYVIGTLDSGTYVEIEGAGTRMFFNPKKSAFRAGYVLGNNWDNDSIGKYSFASGYNTMASGWFSTAIGRSTEASGSSSTAIGMLSKASAFCSTAIGRNAESSGQNSVAIGLNNKAIGGASLALGYTTEAIGQYSITMGVLSKAYSFGETTIGIGATSYLPSTNGASQFRTVNATDRLFVIGNAIDANNNGNVDISERNNALVVLKNGNIGVDVDVPTQKLEVAGNVYSTNGDFYAANSNGVFNAGGGIMSATINYIGDSYIVPSNVGGDEDLYVGDDLEIGDNAYKPGGGSWATASDARLKKEITPYEDGLEELLQIKPVSFKYNDKFQTLNTGKTYIGIIAQDMQKIAPYTVEEKMFGEQFIEDEEGNEVLLKEGEAYLTYDGSALTYMTINAIQEQQKLIENLQAELNSDSSENLNVLKDENEALKTENEKIKARLVDIEEILKLLLNK